MLSRTNSALALPLSLKTENRSTTHIGIKLTGSSVGTIKGRLAQQAEQRAHNPSSAGSSPAAPTIFTTPDSRTYEFPIVPVPKPRMTQQDKWKHRPAVMTYRAFADELRLQARAQDFVLPDSGWSIAFHIPMPDSWSKKKRAEMFGKPHQQRPDWDNLCKSFCDALCTLDETIWECCGVRKYWSDVGRIIVRVE